MVYLRFRDICIVSAHALHKTVHTLQNSYHVGLLCIVLRNTGCCSEHHFEESPFRYIYVRQRQFIRRQPGQRQRLKPYTYSYETEEAPGRRQRLGLYAYSCQTEEAPGQRQRLGSYAYSYWTQEAQLKPDFSTEERTIGSRMTLTYSFLYFFFIYTCTFPYTSSAY